MEKFFLIVLFLLKPLLIIANESSFIASFQSSGHWSKNEFLEYNDSISELKEFTACHWEKARFFSEQYNVPWSYCQYLSHTDQIENKLRCVEPAYLYPSTSGKVGFVTLFEGWTKPNETEKL